MTRHLNGVRVDTDGTRTDIAIPAGTPLMRYFREQFDGFPEYAHYGTAESAVTAVVHETGMLAGLPVNGDAERFVSQLRGGQLDYHLYGPVFFFGYDPHGRDLVDLTGDQRTALNRLPNYSQGGER